MPGVRTVAVKSEEQQAILALHRMRQQLVKFRTAQINGLRGLLTEYGEVMPRGRVGMRRGMADALERVSERLPAMVIDTLREQWARVARLDEEIGEIERRIGLWHRGNADSRRVAEIPGVGVLTATAAVAAMGDPAAFRSGREFAACCPPPGRTDRADPIHSCACDAPRVDLAWVSPRSWSSETHPAHVAGALPSASDTSDARADSVARST